MIKSNYKILVLTTLLIISGFGSFLLSCECIGKGDYCLNFYNVYIRFRARQPDYKDIDTLKAKSFSIITGLCHNSSCNCQTSLNLYGLLNANCMGCFSYLSSYRLTCQNNIISVTQDTIEAGSNLFSNPEISGYIDDWGEINVDSTYKLKVGVNIFQFEAIAEDKIISINDTLFVDSAFGY